MSELNYNNLDNTDVAYENIEQEKMHIYFSSACSKKMTEEAEHLGVKKKEIIVVANRGVIANEIVCEALLAGKKVIVMQDSNDISWKGVYEDENVEIFEFQNCFSVIKKEKKMSDSLRAITALKEKLLAEDIDLNTVAIHPGYGFWSENVGHFEAIEQMGLNIIGPHSSSIHQLGDKINAIKLAKKAGINTPLSSGKINSVNDALRFFSACEKEIDTFLLKDANGGGGSGQLRISGHDIESFVSAVQTFLNTHKNFSIDEYLPKTLHIEFQVLVDMDGNVRFGIPRNCTIQRDYQKYIEEIAQLSPEIIEKMRKNIEALFKKLKDETGHAYNGLATFETLYDPKKKTFYFLEVNTRIQVEHPVSAHFDGINYIRTMLDIADGKSLKTQKEIDKQKIPEVDHVIEARICAEEPVTEEIRKYLSRIGKGNLNFYPTSGTINKWKLPKGENIFVYADPRIEKDCQLPGNHDPMIAQVVISALTREEARLKLLKAVKEFQIDGVGTNRKLIINTLEHQEFIIGGDTMANKTAAPNAIMAVISEKLKQASACRE